MFTKEMQQFYEDMNRPVDLMIARCPYKVQDGAVVDAMEFVYNHLYCYEPIRIPRTIWRIALKNNRKKDYAKITDFEQNELEIYKEKAALYKKWFEASLEKKPNVDNDGWKKRAEFYKKSEEATEQQAYLWKERAGLYKQCFYASATFVFLILLLIFNHWMIT